MQDVHSAAFFRTHLSDSCEESSHIQTDEAGKRAHLSRRECEDLHGAEVRPQPHGAADGGTPAEDAARGSRERARATGGRNNLRHRLPPDGDKAPRFEDRQLRGHSPNELWPDAPKAGGDLRVSQLQVGVVTPAAWHTRKGHVTKKRTQMSLFSNCRERCNFSAGDTLQSHALKEPTK
jgi:hypothetical protein